MEVQSVSPGLQVAAAEEAEEGAGGVGGVGWVAPLPDLEDTAYAQTVATRLPTCLVSPVISRSARSVGRR